MRKPSLGAIEAERICLIKPSSLGDVVQALPVLSALRGRYPRAHIAWVVNRAYAGLIAHHPHLNEVISFDRGRGPAWAPAAWFAMRALCNELRAKQFDLVCDLQGLLRSGVMSWATGARRRVGLADAREGSRFFYSDVVPVGEATMSAVDRYWLVAEALGAGCGPKQFLIPRSRDDESWAARELQRAAVPSVAIHAGARWTTKRWPATYFLDIGKRLQMEFGASIVLVGGPEDQHAVEPLAASLGRNCVNLVGRTTLTQLAAVLARVKMLVTNDSGPMHLAAAVGTPVAALFTCTSPQRARPYGAGHVVLATGVWCAASYLKRCSRLDCMGDLTPDRVWPSIRQRLQRLLDSAAA